jgi:hypothetical protein
MKNIKKFALDFVVPVVLLALPLLAMAAVPTPPSGVAPTSDINNINAVGQAICGITNWLFYFLILLTVIFVIWAAFQYLTAAGDPEKVKSASHALLYAAVAIVVGLLAKATPNLIGSIIGSNSINTSC